MSGVIGLSVGDIFLISSLAWRVYRLCRDSSNEFKALSTEVASLHIVLKETEDQIQQNNVEKGYEARLLVIADGCKDVLEDLESFLSKYESLATKTQRTWDRLRWGSEDARKLRERLVSNTVLLTAFNTSIANTCQARVEKKLNKLLAEVRSGDREGSIISVESVESIENDNKEAWEDLCRELQDLGISPAVASQHRAFIVKWMKEALDTGAFDTAEGLQAMVTGQSTDSGEQSTSFGDTVERSLSSEPSLRKPRLESGSLSRGSVTVTQSKASIAARTLIAVAKPFRSKTAIHRAARDGDLTVIRKTLALGADINFCDSYGLTALHWAIMRGQEAATRLLLDEGADPERRDSDGRTALGVAAWQGLEEVVLMLVECHADLAARDSEGLTPLHGTARNRCPIVAGILLAHGAPVELRDKKGWTALHWAARQGYGEMVKLLIEAGADVRAKSNDGSMPLTLIPGDFADEETVQRLRVAHSLVNST